jgi:hypothetical protein
MSEVNDATCSETQTHNSQPHQHVVHTESCAHATLKLPHDATMYSNDSGHRPITLVLITSSIIYPSYNNQTVCKHTDIQQSNSL